MLWCMLHHTNERWETQRHRDTERGGGRKERKKEERKKRREEEKREMCIIKSIYKKHILMFLWVPGSKNSSSWPVKYYKQACKFFSGELFPNYRSKSVANLPSSYLLPQNYEPESHIDATIFICGWIYQNYVRTPQFPLSSSTVLRKRRTVPFYSQLESALHLHRASMQEPLGSNRTFRMWQSYSRQRQKIIRMLVLPRFLFL